MLSGLEGVAYGVERVGYGVWGMGYGVWGMGYGVLVRRSLGEDGWDLSSGGATDSGGPTGRSRPYPTLNRGPHGRLRCASLSVAPWLRIAQNTCSSPFLPGQYTHNRGHFCSKGFCPPQLQRRRDGGSKTK